MKILETNLNRFPYLNSLMLLTWYLISTLHILPSLVLSHYPDHTIVFVPCLYAFPRGIFFINFLVYSVCLFSLILSLHTLFVVSSQTSFHFNFCFSYSHIYFTENKILIKSLLKKKKKDKTKILTRGGQWSPLLLTFSRAILRPLHIIPTLLLSDHSFQTPSPLHCGPNFLQLGRVPLLALY